MITLLSPPLFPCGAEVGAATGPLFTCGAERPERDRSEKPRRAASGRPGVPPGIIWQRWGDGASE